MAAPLPPNESARIQALEAYRILDSLEEQAFDDITYLASYICNTPIALISLVDGDRQWFKSRVGLQAHQTPREHAFCAHAILAPDDVLVVSDAAADPRFDENPLVTGDPGIRFYAGAPLVTPEGHALGTICVIDRTPRELPAKMIEALRALARQVVAQLELRRMITTLEHNSKRLEDYQQQLEDYQRVIETSNAALAAESTTDNLTGVKNRRAFDVTLDDELARAQRHKTPLSLLLIDVDEFKSFNDRYGHPAGDEALRELGRIMSAGARTYDVVARYGGEEFAVVLPNTGVEGALVVGERLRRAVEAAPWKHRAVTVSIGPGTVTTEFDSAILISAADRALYRAKDSGRNRVTHANSER